MTRAEMLYQIKMLSLTLMWGSLPATLIAIVGWDKDAAMVAAGMLIVGMIGWSAMTRWEESSDG